ncbi:MAG TPA: chemotaxis protein CheB [Puia sp.]|nr:chemotaxis protein CheB [Puia sp.]
MNDIKLIAIGGSAGSLPVILDLVSAIPHGFQTPMLLALHRNGLFESSLEELLSSRTGLQIREVEEKEPITPGTLYICPSDYHVLIEKDHSFSLDYSERVNYSRPSIDVSFRSAADVYGKGLLCLLLSGGNNDGAEGLEYVKEKGGVTVVQDPLTAEVPFMPQAAITRTKIDFVLTPSQMPGLLFPPAFILP